MSGRPITHGTTDVSTVIRIVDSTDGTPETGVEHNTSGIDLWYRREGAVKVSITEAALSALDDAHSDGGIEHIGDGYYRLDLPDAACVSGATGVMIGGTVTDMVVIGTYHPLVAYDPQDATRLGLMALPNAAADAAGGLPISDAGGLDLDAMKSTLDEAAADVVNIDGAAMRGTDGAYTGTPPTAAAIRQEIDANSTKTGYKLASDGLDQIPVADPAGVATTFPQMLVQMWRRFFRKVTLTASELKTYADDGTTVRTTQAMSDDGTTETQGAAS